MQTVVREEKTLFLSEHRALEMGRHSSLTLIILLPAQSIGPWNAFPKQLMKFQTFKTISSIWGKIPPAQDTIIPTNSLPLNPSSESLMELEF